MCCRESGARPAVRVVGVVLGAGCPGRTGARRPPCATSPGERAVSLSGQRLAERAMRAERLRSVCSRMLILAADFCERRAHAEPPMISGRCERYKLDSRRRRRPPTRMRGAHITTNSSAQLTYP